MNIAKNHKHRTEHWIVMYDIRKYKSSSNSRWCTKFYLLTFLYTNGKRKQTYNKSICYTGHYTNTGTQVIFIRKYRTYHLVLVLVLRLFPINPSNIHNLFPYTFSFRFSSISMSLPYSLAADATPTKIKGREREIGTCSQNHNIYFIYSNIYYY